MAQAQQVSENDHQHGGPNEDHTPANLHAGPEAELEQAKKKADAAPHGGLNHHPGGSDSLGKKENLLAPFYEDMQQVAAELVGVFTPLGLHFRPEILLATAMQEAAWNDPANARSFDNGLGIMQITPYKGQLGGKVAEAIGWDNTKGVEWNVQHSKWRDAKANILAGGYTMLGKAQSIHGSVGKIWGEMDEVHRWRAVLYAYNAGEGSAIRALKQGGPNAAMVSTFTYKGQVVTHDYTAEIKQKMDYVDGHDPFAAGGKKDETPAGGGGKTPDTKPAQDTQKPDHVVPPDHAHPIHGSVGQGGVNAKKDVQAVQKRLHERGLQPGPVDGQMGAHTIAAIHQFQLSFGTHADGLIEPGKGTEHHLFFEHGVVSVKEEHATPNNGAAPQAHGTPSTDEKAKDTQVIKNDGELPHVMPGVKLTEPIAANYRVLASYLPAGTVMTSGLRTDADQANLIHRYYHSHGGPAQTEDAEQQREWLHNNHGMIIARVGSSPHRTGLAFDLSGAPIGEINAAVYRCKHEKPSEFHLKDTIVERANNCLHVDVTH